MLADPGHRSIARSCLATRRGPGEGWMAASVLLSPPHVHSQGICVGNAIVTTNPTPGGFTLSQGSWRRVRPRAHVLQQPPELKCP